MINTVLNTSSPNSICGILVNDTVVSDPSIIAESFNSYFTILTNNLVVNDSHKSQDTTTISNPSSSLFLRPTDPHEVRNVILALKNTYSMSLDLVPVSLLKHRSTIICEPLSHIINETFTSGSFPTLLKISKVVPVFKKGDKLNMSNYRPIAVLSPFSKVFEKVTLTRLDKYFTAHNIYAKEQYGYLKGKSTETALINIVEKRK